MSRKSRAAACWTAVKRWMVKNSALWVEQALQTLASLPNVLVLPRTTANGYHDHNFVTPLNAAPNTGRHFAA